MGFEVGCIVEMLERILDLFPEFVIGFHGNKWPDVNLAYFWRAEAGIDCTMSTDEIVSSAAMPVKSSTSLSAEILRYL